MKSISLLLVLIIANNINAQFVKPHPMNINAEKKTSTAWYYPNDTPGKVGQFDKLEIGISLHPDIENKIQNFVSNLRGQKINPYDPEQISITAEFYHKTEIDWELNKTVYGFFYQSYSRDLVNDKWIENSTQLDKFRVRFSPPELGEWKCEIKIEFNNTGSAKLDEFNFSCFASENKGYLQVSKNNQFLKTSKEGETFFPIGAAITHSNYNLLTPSSSVKHLDWIRQLADNGGNYFRLEMGGQNFLPDWDNYNNYTTKLEEMTELDHLIDYCAGKGVYFGVFRHHVETIPDKHNNVSWENNPYVRSLNLTSGLEFFQDSTAIKWQKNCLRYTFARWGYAPQFSTFGYAEVDNWMKILHLDKGYDLTNANSTELEKYNETSINDFKPWLVEMYNHIDQVGGENVLKLSYYANTPGYELTNQSKGVFRLGDLVGFNKYADGKDRNFGKLGNGKTGRHGYTERLSKTYNKPVMATEIGFRSGARTDFVKVYCASGLDVHSDIWATSLSGNCASGMLWWWDRGVFDSEHPKHFNHLEEFFKNEDLISQSFDAYKWSDKTGNDNYKAKLESYYLLSEDKTKALGLIHNMTAYWRNMGKYNPKIQELIDLGGISDPCYSWDSIKLGHNWEPATDFTGYQDIYSETEGAIVIVDETMKVSRLKSNVNFLGANHWYRINYYSINKDDFKVVRSEIAKTNIIGVMNVPLPTLDPNSNPDYAYKITYLGKSRKQPK